MQRLSTLAAMLLIALIVSPVTAPLGACDLGDLVGISVPHDIAPPGTPDPAALAKGSLTHVLPGLRHTSRSRHHPAATDSLSMFDRAPLSDADSNAPDDRPIAARLLTLVLRI